MKLVANERAKRMCAEIRMHYLVNGTFDIQGQWFAVRLSDGGSDGNLYPSKEDAVRHQLHPTQSAYVCMRPGLDNELECHHFLNAIEKIYDAGLDLADPNMNYFGRM